MCAEEEEEELLVEGEDVEEEDAEVEEAGGEGEDGVAGKQEPSDTSNTTSEKVEAEHEG